VQRSLAGVLFLLASIALSVAAGGWWLQRTALTPNATTGQTRAILDETDIRAEIVTVVAAVTAATIEQEPNEVAAFIDPIIASQPGAALMTGIVESAHERITGMHDDPVRITGEQMVRIVRDERVAGLDAVTLPVPRIGTLDLLRSVLTWLAPIMAILGALLALLAFATRPDKGEVMRAVGELGIALAASILLFGYALPVHLVPAIDDNTWTRAVPQLALRSLPVVIGASIVLVLGGVALIVAASGSGKRKQWSTPLAVGRYRDERSWS
jgi:cytochrome bd-type quinol oxidase subunit 2